MQSVFPSPPPPPPPPNKLVSREKVMELWALSGAISRYGNDLAQHGMLPAAFLAVLWINWDHRRSEHIVDTAVQ